MRKAIAKLLGDVQVVCVEHERRNIVLPPRPDSAAFALEHHATTSEERSTGRLQPAFRLAESRIHRFHESPEPTRVVLLTHVHQLVKQYVVADVGRHLHQPEVQRDFAI
jgi:hypothetical protein